MNYPGLFGSPNTGTNDPKTINMSQRELQELQDQIQSQQPSQQSQQPQEPYTPTLADTHRHYHSVPNMSQESSNSNTRNMTDAEVKAYYGLSNHTGAVPRTPAYAPAPRNMTPVYALAPAPASAPTSAPDKLYEMAKKYVKKGKDGFREEIYFYKDDDKKNPPTKGIVWDTNFFGKTYDIAVGNNRFKVNEVYTPNFDKSGGRRRKSKKMYKKRKLQKNSKSKSKRRHSRSRRH